MGAFRAQEIQVANRDLEAANEQLQEQAVELEAQREELQCINEELERHGAAREAALRALAEREARYRALVQATAQIVWTTDATGEFVAEQPDWAAFTGQTFAEYRGLGWIEAIHPDDRDVVATAWRRAVATSSVCAVEYRVRRHDGVYRTFSVRAVPVRDAIGPVREWVGSETDVTEQRATEQTLREHEREFRTLAESIPQLAWMAEPDGYIFWYNQRWYDYTGTTPEQMAGWGWQSVHDPLELPRVLERWRASIATGAPFELEFPLRRSDGRFEWFLTRSAPVVDAEGRVVRWFGTNTNIDEQRAAARAVQERQERLAAALHASGTGTFRWDIRTNSLDWDDSLDRLFGLAPGATVRSLDQFLACLHPEDRARVVAACERCAAEGVDFDEAFRVVWPDGTVRWLDDKGKTFRDAEGTPCYMTGACVDITERVAREEALQERARLAAFTADVGSALTQSATLGEMLRRCCEVMVEHLDAAFARIWTLDPAAQVLELQASAGLYTGLEGAHSRIPVGRFNIGRIAEERRPHLTNDVLHDERISDPAWAAREGMVAFAGFPLTVGDRLDGVMALFARRALSEATLEALGAVAHGIALGIERQRAEEQNARLAALVHNTDDFVGMSTLDGIPFFVNEAGRQLVGAENAEELFRTPVVEYFLPEDQPRVRDEVIPAVLREGRWSGELRFRHFRTGAAVPMLYRIFTITDPATGEPVALATVSPNLTERLRIERQLRQAQQLQAVGTLAGGVAHEVNNQLTAVLGFGAFALKGLGPDHPQAADVQQMVRAAERSAAITQQLLAFGRRQLTHPRVLDPHAVVTELGPVLVQLLGADKALVLPPSRSRRLIRADPTQLEQVLINLTANARDAMASGGRLTITLEDVTLDAAHAEGHGGVQLMPGPYVLLAVSDTGKGMDRATLDKIFEPFFTTKPIGQGTGLGLSTVYGIVKQHGGFVWTYSEPGVGTTMKVYLPAAPQTEVEDSPVAELPPPASGGRTILVVEDEPVVRQLARRTLEDAGYAVLEAENGHEALQLVREAAQLPDLIVTDLIMPELNGREFGEALTRLGQNLPVLYMSGYAGADVVLRRLLPEGAPFLQKPFAPEELVRRVSQLVGDPLA